MKAHSKRDQQRKSKAGFDFEKAFVRYAVAGSAIMGLPFAASAQYPSQSSLPVTISTGGTSSLPVSFDGSATDFTLGTTFFAGVLPYVDVTLGSGGTAFLGSNNYPAAFLSSGAVISAASGSTTTGTILDGIGISKSPFGNWPNDGTTGAYLGVLFQISGQPYVGWADIVTSVSYSAPPENPQLPGTAQNVSYASATLVSYGDAPLATPEPSSLALLALGASGLALLRRRRKSAS